MDTQQQLYGLIAIAEEHQQAIKIALDGLTAEREALAHERIAVAHAAASVAGIANEVKRAINAALPDIQSATKGAVSDSLKQVLDHTSKTAAKAFETGLSPTLDQLSQIVSTANGIESHLRKASSWLTWKVIVLFAAGLIGVCAVAYASVAWELNQATGLKKQKAALAADIAQMQTTIQALERKGGRIVMSTCDGRLCIEASSNQGKNYEQWHGAVWSNKETGLQLVIPDGY